MVTSQVEQYRLLVLLLVLEVLLHQPSVLLLRRLRLLVMRHKGPKLLVAHDLLLLHNRLVIVIVVIIVIKHVARLLGRKVRELILLGLIISRRGLHTIEHVRRCLPRTHLLRLLRFRIRLLHRPPLGLQIGAAQRKLLRVLHRVILRLHRLGRTAAPRHHRDQTAPRRISPMRRTLLGGGCSRRRSRNRRRDVRCRRRWLWMEIKVIGNMLAQHLYVV